MSAHDLSGQNIIITGANTGIGKCTAEALARRGARVIFAGRSAAKTQPVIDQLKKDTGNDQLEFLELDLGSLASVKKAADSFLARKLPLHVLINNAGLAGLSGLTVDGYQITFGTNHLGPYLFTRLLHPALKSAGTSRVVNVASRAHERCAGIDFEVLQKPETSMKGLTEYGVSKLANVLFSKELGKRWAADGIHTYSLHPGVIASDIWRNVPWPLRLMTKFMKTTEEGAVASIQCAVGKETANETGLYYGEDGRVRRQNRLVDDPALLEKLWSWSETQVRAYLP